jgi:hypothetical protein
MEFLGKISEELKFLQVTTPFEEIKSRFNRFKKTEEELKSKLKLLLEDDLLKEAITKDMLDSYHKYADKELPYFGKQSYFEENLNILYTALNLLHFLNDRKFFLLKRRILVYQEGLM